MSTEKYSGTHNALRMARVITRVVNGRFCFFEKWNCARSRTPAFATPPEGTQPKSSPPLLAEAVLGTPLNGTLWSRTAGVRLPCFRPESGGRNRITFWAISTKLVYRSPARRLVRLDGVVWAAPRWAVFRHEVIRYLPRPSNHHFTRVLCVTHGVTLPQRIQCR